MADGDNCKPVAVCGEDGKRRQQRVTWDQDWSVPDRDLLAGRGRSKSQALTYVWVAGLCPRKQATDGGKKHPQMEPQSKDWYLPRIMASTLKKGGIGPQPPDWARLTAVPCRV